MAKPKSGPSSERPVEVTLTDTQIVDWLIAAFNASTDRYEQSVDSAYGQRARSIRVDRTFGELVFPAKTWSWRLTHEELAAAVQQRIVEETKQKLLR